MTEPVIYDSWTPLSFKRAMGSRTSGGTSWSAPAWTGEHKRRLMAYTILRAYQDNAARSFMGTADPSKVEGHREYGDAALVVSSVVAALLGESQEIVVPGADDYDEDGEAEGETPPDGSEAAFRLQEWLRDWADTERLPLKMIETERNAVGMGDGVYTLGWSASKGRPRLRVWDPGFYFPVLDDDNEDDYPSRVHLAWELESAAPGKRTVRRITWELGSILPERDADGLIAALTGREPTLLEGDRYDEDFRIVRDYPWNEEPSAVTCYLTDATWELDTAASSIDDLAGGTATYAYDEEGEVNRRDLRIDFLPVVHVPNTVALLDHYGRSTLATVLQILDDLAASDTDLQSASATTGSPVIALSKATLGGGRATYRPGEIFELGDGKMDVMDTSRSLDALIKYVEHLLGRLSVNSRVPESVLGRVKPSEVPSGVALALSFGPLAAMIAEMRLVRDEKYPLLLKFVHRLALAGGSEGVPADWAQAGIKFGSFLPQDRAAAVETVVKLLGQGAISLEAAVALLVEAGFPVEDAAEEVRRIESRDFKGAGELVDALGDEGPAYDYLGLEQPDEPPARPQVDPVLPVPAAE